MIGKAELGKADYIARGITGVYLPVNRDGYIQGLINNLVLAVV